MATATADIRRVIKSDDTFNDLPMAVDICYEGAAVGVVDATGHAQPLTSSDRFVGFAQRQADNSAGSAADIDVRVQTRGVIKLSVSGAVITDVGMPIYATDDTTFVFSPVGGVFIGFVSRFVSSGVVEVGFDVKSYADPYAAWTDRETVSVDKTLDIEDTGKLLWFDTDTKTITLLTYAAATALEGVLIVNGGAFGTVEVLVDPAAGDKIVAGDDTGADGGIATNTKATARRNDSILIETGGDDGYTARLKGIWTIA
jgi:hypothetical protein